MAEETYTTVDALVGASPLQSLETSGDHVFVPARVPFGRIRWLKLRAQRQQIVYWTALLLILGLTLVTGGRLMWLGALLLLCGLVGLGTVLTGHLALRPYVHDPRIRMVLSKELVLVSDGEPPATEGTRRMDWVDIVAVTTGVSSDRKLLLAFRGYDPRSHDPSANDAAPVQELRVVLDMAHVPDVHRLLPWIHRFHPGVALLAVGGAGISDWLTLRPALFPDLEADPETEDGTSAQSSPSAE